MAPGHLLQWQCQCYKLYGNKGHRNKWLDIATIPRSTSCCYSNIYKTPKLKTKSVKVMVCKHHHFSATDTFENRNIPNGNVFGVEETWSESIIIITGACKRTAWNPRSPLPCAFL